MVDTALYVGMTGARQSLHALRVISNNLANANTVGFRADYETIKTIPTNKNKLQTRIYSAPEKTYSDFKQGPMIDTGGDLDIAINGRGFIAVQTKEGKEAFTRAGNLQVTKEGLIVTGRGDMVLGSSGVITIPPSARINIGEQGTITVQPLGQSPNELTKLGSIKLVDISYNQLQKGEDGLFYLEEGGSVTPSASVKITTGVLEGSNVDPVRALSELIDISRQFEMHTKMMKSIEDNSGKANQLLNITE